MAGDRGPRRRLGSRATTSLVAQGIFSANSLVLTLIAGWLLDQTSFGWFGLMFAMYSLSGSVLDAFIGEARAVLDISDAGLRGALAWAQGVLIVAGVVTAAVVGVLGGLPNSAVVAGAVAGGAWVAEAGVRRVLAARLAFGSLIINDLTFLGVALFAIAVLNLRGPIDLSVVLTGWAFGAFASVVVGLFQMTALERDPGHVDRRAVNELLGFGTWRVLQSALRPFALLAVRFMVLAWVSAAAVAEIELARVVAAPISTGAAGVSQFLLPRMANDRDGADSLMRRAERWLAGATLAYAAVVVIATIEFGDQLTAIATELDPAAVTAWVLVGLAMSIGVPAMSRLVAVRRAREVFVVRLVDNLAGLGAAAIVIALAPSGWAPAGVGMSGIAAAFWLRRAAKRIDDTWPTGSTPGKEPGS